MDFGTLAIGGVTIVPLIVGIIQALKRFAPDADGNVWFGMSILLGVVGMGVVLVIGQGTPALWTFEQWAAAVVLGLSFGLSAGKAYDETLGKGPAS